MAGLQNWREGDMKKELAMSTRW